MRQTEIPSGQVAQEPLVYHQDQDAHLSQMLPVLPGNASVKS